MQKFNVKKSFLDIIVVGLFSVLAVLSVVACTQKPQRIESVDLYDVEMGVEDTAAQTSWDSADPTLKGQFTEEYNSTKNKRKVFEKYIDPLGAGAMLDYLEQRYQRCHGQAHGLGKAVFAHSKDINKALRTCGNRCTNACMHGVVSEAFGGKELEEITSKMTGFCKEGEMSKLHKPGNCAHGIGHALMIITKHDIDRSLSGCEEFSTPGMDYYCATGVFMEYRGMLRYKIVHGEKVKQPTLHYPCDTYTKFPAACYRYMMPIISYKLNNDRQMLVEECLKLPDPQRLGCFHGYGKMNIRKVYSRPALLREICDVGTRENQIMCIEGVIEKLAEYDQRSAMIACSILEGENAKVCYEAAKEKMYRLNKPTLKLYRP